MPDTRLILPMAALVILTVAVSLVMVRRRFAAARAGTVKVSDFRVNQFGEDTPQAMLQAGRNYANLFEMPVVFYAVCTAAMAARLTDTVLVALAWVYVGLRVVHSIIHLGANDVMWRMRIFGLSMLVVLGMWLYLAARAVGVGA